MQTQKQSVQSEMKPQSIQDAIGFLKKASAYTIEHKLIISPEGEYLRFGNAKEALDVLNHINQPLRKRGFGAYALHNALWLVPFVHSELHIPNFKKAVGSLPDHLSEIQGKVMNEPTSDESTNPTLANSIQWMKKNKWLLAAAAVGFFILMF